MRAARLSGSILALSLGSGLLGSGVGFAQATYRAPYPAAPSPYAVQPLSDADLLSSELRLLAADPNNLQALVRAGELALKLGDDTAAAAFFARAERIDPHNGRVKAGEGSLLVAAERPGEALRRFAEAESYGADPRGFAADRGLAYDLIGEQDRAQRDYRLALRGGANDETQRRYALSLGISGKRELALTQIDPLLRKSDRGAWRARAFILAMGGDRGGAETIATSMMPVGMAQGLQPFFDILPTLRPADRAFAVHFGEIRATPERLADARLVPPLATLRPDPTAPVEAIAAVAVQPVAVADMRQDRKARRKRGRDQVAAVTTPPPAPLPAPPAYAAQPVTAPVVLASNSARLPAVGARVTPGASVTLVQRAMPGAGTITTRSTPIRSSAIDAAAQRVMPGSSAPFAERPTAVANLAAARSASAVATPAASGAVPVPETNVRVFASTAEAALPTLTLGARPAPTAETTVRLPATPAAAALPAAPVGRRSSGNVIAAAETNVRVAAALPVMTTGTRSATNAMPLPETNVRVAATPASNVAPVSAASTGAVLPGGGVGPLPETNVAVAASPARSGTAVRPVVADAVLPSADTGVSVATTAAPVATTAVPASTLAALPNGGSVPAANGQVGAGSPVTRAAPLPVRSEESILAAIIADIKVPGGEVAKPNVVTSNRPALHAVAAGSVADRAVAGERPTTGHGAANTSAPDRTASGKKTALADKSAAGKKTELGETAAADKTAAPADRLARDKDKLVADKKATADKKALADKKTAAEKKAADAKNLADAKKAEEKRRNDPKLLEPSRVWVQVAGGANESTLPKAWAAVRAKSKAFGSKGGWTTPLRATNRILTGPFKSDDEAQKFVNTLTRDGLSGFVFVSEAGQKVTKLAGK